MPRNIFLYLALACFLALIIIFVIDGYLGVYDTIYITSGEREQKIGPDFWSQQRPYPDGGQGAYYLSAIRGDRIHFRYEVDNRWFSLYATDAAVSVWRSQQKERDLVSQSLEIAPFAKSEFSWLVNTEELKPSGITPEQSYEFSLLIRRGEIERKVIVNASSSLPYPAKVVPIPAPVEIAPPVPAR